MLEKEIFSEDFRLQSKIDACPISWEQLVKIYDDFEKNRMDFGLRMAGI